MTAAGSSAQRLIAADTHPDRAAGRIAAEHAITAYRSCPVPEINRLGRTLTAWRDEFLGLARFDQLGSVQRPDRTPQPHQEHKRTARGTDHSKSTGCDCFSITASPAMINKRRGSEPADPAWLHSTIKGALTAVRQSNEAGPRFELEPVTDPVGD